MPPLKGCLSSLTNTTRTGWALESKGTTLLKQAGKNEECYVLFPNLLFFFIFLRTKTKPNKKQAAIFDWFLSIFYLLTFDTEMC